MLKRKQIVTFCKILLIGTLTTVVRSISQLLIPAGNQQVLEPSIFIRKGIMAEAFIAYGIFAYSAIAALFLLLQSNPADNKLGQGLKYGVSCCAIWIIYLLEPLPHVAPLDKITYPMADSLALIVCGVLIGLLSVKAPVTDENRIHRAPTFKSKPYVFLFIAIVFVIGRLFQYLILDIYSCFDDAPIETLLWSLATGLILACVANSVNKHLTPESRFKRAATTGVLLFGVNLTTFNFFMPLVFDIDLLDLVARTSIDILAITLGSLVFLTFPRTDSSKREP